MIHSIKPVGLTLSLFLILWIRRVESEEDEETDERYSPLLCQDMCVIGWDENIDKLNKLNDNE